MMERRAFVAGSLTLLATPLAAEAQPAGKVPRLGVLDASSPRPELWTPFKAWLHELGYIEGQHIVFEFLWAHDRHERLPTLAADLVARKVDIIVTTGTPAAQAAKRATKTIPIVMASGGNPVARGLVASLARPGGNLTGVTSLVVELAGKRVQLLRELVPKLSRLAVLWDLTNPTTADDVREEREAAQSLGMRVQVLGVHDAREFDRAFSAMTREHADALVVNPSAPLVSERRRLAELALKHRLPAAFGRRDFVDAGGLISYAPSFSDMFRRAADYVDKILKGAKPADLPVEQPTKFELVINLKTAKALGLTIPPAVLARADEVIE